MMPPTPCRGSSFLSSTPSRGVEHGARLACAWGGAAGAAWRFRHLSHEEDDEGHGVHPARALTRRGRDRGGGRRRQCAARGRPPAGAQLRFTAIACLERGNTSSLPRSFRWAARPPPPSQSEPWGQPPPRQKPGAPNSAPTVPRLSADCHGLHRTQEKRKARDFRAFLNFCGPSRTLYWWS